MVGRNHSGHVPQVDTHVEQFFQQLAWQDSTVNMIADEPFQVTPGDRDIDVVGIGSHGTDCAPRRRPCPRNIIPDRLSADQRQNSGDERSVDRRGLTGFVVCGQFPYEFPERHPAPFAQNPRGGDLPGIPGPTETNVPGDFNPPGNAPRDGI